MSWDKWYEDVWDALVAQVVAMGDIDEDKVFYGEKFTPIEYPCCFVVPEDAESIPATFKESEWYPAFGVGFGVQDNDQKAGMLAAWKLCWKFAEQISGMSADRTLGGILHNLECGPITPYWRNLGRGLEIHWVGVTVRCRRKM